MFQAALPPPMPIRVNTKKTPSLLHVFPQPSLLRTGVKLPGNFLICSSLVFNGVSVVMTKNFYHLLRKGKKTPQASQCLWVQLDSGLPACSCHGSIHCAKFLNIEQVLKEIPVGPTQTSSEKNGETDLKQKQTKQQPPNKSSATFYTVVNNVSERLRIKYIMKIFINLSQNRGCVPGKTKSIGKRKKKEYSRQKKEYTSVSSMAHSVNGKRKLNRLVGY